MTTDELKEFLDFKYDFYNRSAFIETDPISIPHLFNIKEDIEISAFLTATIAWGQRKAIISNARKLLNLMGNSPYSFIMEADEHDFEKASKFVHRTFNHEDTFYFLNSLQHIYRNKGGLQTIFENAYQESKNVKTALTIFRRQFLEHMGHTRTSKHVSDVERGSSGKRLNMFLRWMVRNDLRGVDFGIWNGIPASALYLPLDLHTGNVSRKLGLLLRKQDDWKAVEEVTSRLLMFDPCDPVKYDFALFGLGVFEKF
jgi:uncharacterized protein (TIGR02757 family)